MSLHAFDAFGAVDEDVLVATHSTTSPNARVRRGWSDDSGRGPTSTVLLVSHAFSTYSVSVTPTTRITAGASLFAPVIVNASGPPANTASKTLSGTSINILFGSFPLPSSEQCICRLYVPSSRSECPLLCSVIVPSFFQKKMTINQQQKQKRKQKERKEFPIINFIVRNKTLSLYIHL